MKSLSDSPAGGRALGVLPHVLHPVLVLGGMGAISWQQWAKYNGAAEWLWPGMSVVSVVWLVVVFAYLALARRAQDEGWMPPPVVRLALAGAVLFAGIFWLAPHARAFERILWFEPLDPHSGDMLPLVERSLRTLVTMGEFPYGPYEVASWNSYMTYLPGLWLPFALPYSMGLDIRTWMLVATLLMGAMCVLWVAIRVAEGVTLRETAGALMPLAVPWLLFHTWAFEHFFTSVHVAGFWLTLMLWTMAVLMGFPRIGAVLFSIAAASRPYMVVVGPFYALYLFRLWQRDRRAAYELFVWLCVPFAMLMLPFLLIDAKATLYGLTTAYDDICRAIIYTDPTVVEGFGLTAFFQKNGLDAWRNKVMGMLMLGLLALAWFRMRSEEDLLRFSAAALMLFMCFTVIPFFYIFVGPLVMLALLNPGAGRLAALEPKVRGGFLVVGVVLMVLLWTAVAWRWLTHPVRRMGYTVEGGTHRYFEARRLMTGFPEHYWQSNTGTAAAPLVANHHFVAIPSREAKAQSLDILFDIPPSGQLPRFHVAINGHPAGNIGGPEFKGHSATVRVPAGGWHVGLNRVHLARVHDEATTGTLGDLNLQLRQIRVNQGGENARP